MLEIRELVVKVNVTDDMARSNKDTIDKNELVKACVKQVMRKLEKRNKR